MIPLGSFDPHWIRFDMTLVTEPTAPWLVLYPARYSDGLNLYLDPQVTNASKEYNVRNVRQIFSK